MKRLPDPETQSEFYKDVPVKRLIAWIIDGAITFAITLVITLLSAFLFIFIFLGLWAFISILYRTLFISKWSATPGMRFVGIRFLDAEGRHFDFATTAFHTGGTFVAFSTGLQFISIILMLVTARGQGLVDLVLGTTAVNDKARF